MKKLVLFFVLLSVVGGAFTAGCTQQQASSPPEPGEETPLPTETLQDEGITLSENETGEGLEGSDSLINEMVRAGDYSTFLDYVYLAKVNEDLSGSGPYTVFAPVDRSVSDYIPLDKENELRTYAEISLEPLVRGHIVEGEYTSEDFITPTNLTTLAGTSIEVVVVNDNLTVDGIPLTAPDLLASNGVVHGIDGVILPSGF
ncbi:putative surface protein with fasciclin (FAS1) repeats [Methanofollis sp. W23]|uniref:fasciclin domain-containing protein n=1 Tax=Methanofollis sp. W23 TaxID=2817849 RepID=UPI001AE89A79|nr:fasciclin domain-containing protein [Methanofollis sp. W23]MBP2146809.1 putative surface protein with fasciclin (FAS1) repeats [Methanofollis sp. W23]